jgi:CTP:molybdopterin cytidylyltransferase MocA
VIGVILAGGRATRLGPLATQLNKSLVSVGQKPMLVHQVQQLRKAGCGQINVVVSESQRHQVDEVITRAELDDVLTYVQQPWDVGTGPGAALYAGIRYVRDRALVIMADTWLEDSDLPTGAGDCVSVAIAPGNRPWCVWDAVLWRDGTPVGHNATVAVGAFCFEDTRALRDAMRPLLSFAPPREELGMAAVLNAYAKKRGRQPVHKVARTWLDVGDLGALARARQSRFIARDGNRLVLSDDGALVKTGSGPGFIDELRWMSEPPGEIARHVPRVWDATVEDIVTWGGKVAAQHAYYSMEFHDLPTLTELWLYWPGTPDMWAYVIERLCSVLDRGLWRHSVGGTKSALVQLAEHTRDRWCQRILERWGDDVPPWLDALTRAGHELGEARRDRVMTNVHGDPNFSNVLFSLTTSTFKLVDPGFPFGDPLYDLAKIRYSYEGWSEAVHGIGPLVHRSEERDEMDTVLLRYARRYGADASDLLLATALVFASGAPLHSGEERVRLENAARWTYEEAIR